MYSNSILSASAKWEFSTSGSGTTQTGGDAFSKLFESIRGGSQSGLDSILDKLGERFPSLSVNGKPAASGESAASGEAAEEAKDTVEINESALAEMSASDHFAGLVEKAISSFMDATSKIQPPAGVNSFRSISISISVSTFTYGQTDAASGETLMSQELQTSLKDRIEEMMQRFFGTGKKTTTEEPVAADEESGADETAEAIAKKEEEEKFSFPSQWSMQMYFSMSMFSGNTTNPFMNGMDGMSGMGGSFSSQIAGMFGSSNGNMMDFSQSMSSLGMNMNGFQQSSAGFSFRLSQSRNLLSELMEMLQNRQPAVKEPQPTAPEAEDEDAAAEAAEEVAATVQD